MFLLSFAFSRIFTYLPLIYIHRLFVLITKTTSGKLYTHMRFALIPLFRELSLYITLARQKFHYLYLQLILNFQSSFPFFDFFLTLLYNYVNFLCIYYYCLYIYLTLDNLKKFLFNFRLFDMEVFNLYNKIAFDKENELNFDGVLYSV